MCLCIFVYIQCSLDNSALLPFKPTKIVAITAVVDAIFSVNKHVPLDSAELDHLLHNCIQL